MWTAWCITVNILFQEKKKITERSSSRDQKDPDQPKEQESRRRDGEKEHRRDRERSEKHHRSEQDRHAKDRDKDKSRDRERDKDKGRVRDRERDRDREKDKERDREKTRERDSHRERDKEKRRDRDREKERERHKDGDERKRSGESGNSKVCLQQGQHTFPFSSRRFSLEHVKYTACDWTNTWKTTECSSYSVCVCVQVRISEEQQKPSPEEPIKTAKPAPAVSSVFSDIWQIKSFLSFTDINDREVQWFHLLTLEWLILTHHTGSWTILISFLIFFASYSCKEPNPAEEVLLQTI